MTELTRERFERLVWNICDIEIKQNRLDLPSQLLNHDAAQREKLERLNNDYKKLVVFYDQHVGTPCEQIRHQQEVDELKEKLAAVEKQLTEAQAKLKQMEGKL